MVQMNDIPEDSRIIAEEICDKGILTLNRPEALNAFDLVMSDKITACISKWKDTKSMILIKGIGDKAFCVGGDVKSLIESDNTFEALRRSVRTMYPVNYMIKCMKIPYVAFIDGITVGGGAGISVHGNYRIATERTIYIMTEVAIGNCQK